MILLYPFALFTQSFYQWKLFLYMWNVGRNIFTMHSNLE